MSEPLLATVVLIFCWSMWVRRESLAYPFEKAPTVVAAGMVLSVSLTSGAASRVLNRTLHDLTGVWNVEDLVGHLLTLACIGGAISMFLARFGNAEAVHRRFVQWVVRPIIFAVPAMIYLHIWGAGGTHYWEHLESVVSGMDLRMTLYWLVYGGTSCYMLFGAWRLLKTLRITDERRHVVIDIYTSAVIATAAGAVQTLFHAAAPHWFHICWLMWTFGALGAIAWSVAPAYSWVLKSRPLVIVDPNELREFASHQDDEDDAA
ncbi:gp55 protein [Mycolicibacterium phlei]|nr:gp55 protein [Mycolicibacterium phlei]